MAKWWSMSLRERSIAKKKDEDYIDENGSLKDFSKEVWKASCKWQRRMRDRLADKLESQFAVSHQSTETPNQPETIIIDDDDDQDQGIDDVVARVGQQFHERMQEKVDEINEAHQEEKEKMSQIHKEEMERQRLALARKSPKMPPTDAIQKAFISVRWRKRGTSLATLGKELTAMDASKASINTVQEHYKDAMVRFFTSSDYFDALKNLEDVNVDSPPDELPPFFRWKLTDSHQRQWLALCYWAERYLRSHNQEDVGFGVSELVSLVTPKEWFVQECNSVHHLSLVSEGSCYHDPEKPHQIDVNNDRKVTTYVKTLFDYVDGFFYSKFGNVDKLFASKGFQVPNHFSSVYKCS